MESFPKLSTLSTIYIDLVNTTEFGYLYNLSIAPFFHQYNISKVFIQHHDAVDYIHNNYINVGLILSFVLILILLIQLFKNSIKQIHKVRRSLDSSRIIFGSSDEESSEDEWDPITEPNDPVNDSDTKVLISTTKSKPVVYLKNKIQNLSSPGEINLQNYKIPYKKGTIQVMEQLTWIEIVSPYNHKFRVWLKTHLPDSKWHRNSQRWRIPKMPDSMNEIMKGLKLCFPTCNIPHLI